MAAPIIIPEPQLSDADGKPYAGGTIGTFIVGTDTPKDCWLDPGKAALQTNPIVLDAAGRCVMYGDGDYRLILKDADGNLIWDQPSTSVVSDAMAPVVAAASIADAQSLLGITDSTGDVSTINGQITTLTTDLNNEVTRATGAEANLQSQITAITGGSASGGSVRAGVAATDSAGNIAVTFSPAFPGALIYFTVIPPGGALLVTGAQPPAGQPAATIMSVSVLSRSAVTAIIGNGTSAYGPGIIVPWYAIGV